MCKPERNFYRTARLASPLKIISFAEQRLLSCTTLKYFPELRPYQKFFGSGSHSGWVQELSYHSAVLRRGHQQRLCPMTNATKFLNFRLGQYLMKLHSDKIADVLESLVVFAHRIVPIILNDEDAPAWWLNKKMLVQRRHWISFCRRVMAFISLVLVHENEGEQPISRPSPGEQRLRATAHHAALIYGAFDAYHRG
jgi:hypothetical protein